MGYYIQGPAKGKVEHILAECEGAKEVSIEEATGLVDSGLVCVVDNGMFEAAGFVYSKREFEEFADPIDSRPKRWLSVPREWAEKESGYRV